ncbi:heavy metal-(Cd/Co/Hg/Pb/Zn)-translocating P-type ATPase [Tardiphaga sp. OK245]|nr:heavy metal-(Cd/Co/Hg/Pb/Zn)-translocating P-type ATPase [Tardiphaga sp. OK245]
MPRIERGGPCRRRLLKNPIFWMRGALIGAAALGLCAGLASPWMGLSAWRATIWTVSAFPVLVALLAQIATGLRRGEFGLDIVAAFSMIAALSTGEQLAAVVVALMYAGGQFLEAYADRSARREMTALLSRVPLVAMRLHDGRLEEVPVDALASGDHLLIRQGDPVPTDGTVTDGVAILDESALTGEAMPVRRSAGESVSSGVYNAGDAFTMLASRPAAESTFAGIVRLVEAAQQSKAPMSRLADRFAMAFLLLTAGIAGLAWYFSGDVIRVVAVLVVATPCPLILAVPIAFIAGLSRAARHGILIKGGSAIEGLARIQRLVLDKTGTLTDGRPNVLAIHANGVSDLEVFRLAASLDQVSKHVVAGTIVEEARRRGLELSLPTEVVETPGDGIIGRVDGRRVVVGGSGFVSRNTICGVSPMSAHPDAGSLVVMVGLDGRAVGEIVLGDRIRRGMSGLLDDLRRRGIQRIVLATGDRRDIAEATVTGLGFDAVHAELSPDQKTEIVRAERKGGRVMMVGDGINDAPALAAADIGVAMGARGAAASSEAADVVLLVDRLDRVLVSIDIAKRSRAIAYQSVLLGTGLSIVGMIAAALGYLAPVQGALLQEVIDVAAIANALRALRGPISNAPLAP